MARILVVDDEEKTCELLKRLLERDGHSVRVASNGMDALALVEAERPDVVFTDLLMVPMDGQELLVRLKDRDPGIVVVMITGHGGVDEAVAAMGAGAANYLQKPLDLGEVRAIASRAVELHELQRGRERSRELNERASEPWDLIGDSPAMQGVKDLVLRVAPTDATVLIRGESGTGKELCARAIHRHGGRRGGPFVAVNCAAIPDTLLESELFGYVKGAFTGADTDKKGFFELADGGTIFLDELGEANSGVQSKLLRALEERKFIPVGGRREIEVDVRIVAATNKDLEKLIEEDRFREDLYYRFNVFPIDLPPLRDRIEDIAPIAAKLIADLGRRGDALDPAVLRTLQTHSWPGNVRELRNTLERALILAGDGAIRPEHVVLPRARGSARAGDEPVDLDLEAHERHLIRLALKRAQGNKTRAAEMLGLTRRALYSRMERLSIPIDGEGA